MKRMVVWFLCFAALLAGCAAEPAEQETPEQTLLWLYDVEIADGGITGCDANGESWFVQTDWVPNLVCAWVRYTGQAEKSDGYWTVSAAEVWNDRESGAYDVCQFDCDGDGVNERLEIIRTADSEAVQFELVVYDGDICRSRAAFYTDAGAIDAFAFEFVDGKPVIRAVFWAYGAESWEIHTYNIRFQNGEPVVSKSAQ